MQIRVPKFTSSKSSSCSFINIWLELQSWSELAFRSIVANTGPNPCGYIYVSQQTKDSLRVLIQHRPAAIPEHWE